MVAYVVVFGCSLVAGLVLTPLVRWVARRLRVLDLPDGFRKLQERPVPRMGGIAIFIGLFASLWVSSRLHHSVVLPRCFGNGDFSSVFLGAAAVLVIGLWDDARGLGARTKFALLTAVAAGMCVAGHTIETISNPFGRDIVLGYWAVPATLFWFLACMNAMNLIDGLDGLSGGVAVFAAATMFATSALFQNGNIAFSALALAGVGIGFLVFNLPPASIFLGDSGSYLLGFLVAYIGLRGSQKANTVVALLIPVIALGLPVLDTALAILRRWARALPLFTSDGQHIHHKLLGRGLSHWQAVLIMYAACIVLGGFALALTAARDLSAAGVLLLLTVATVLAVRVVGREEIRLAKNRLIHGLAEKRRATGQRAAGHEATERMRQAETIAALWQAFAAAAERMELDRAVMTMTPPRPLPSRRRSWRTFRWRRDAISFDSGEVSASWSASFPLIAGGAKLGELEVNKSTNGCPLAPELPEMLQLLSSGLADNISRVRPDAADEQRLRVQAG